MAREKRLYYRRCHVCGDVTEGNSPIKYCEHCHKPLATFCYFNEHEVVAFSENRERPQYKGVQVIPVIGLSAYWGMF